MTNPNTDSPAASGVGWQIACAMAVLVAAAGGLIYFQYYFDWRGGGVMGLSRVEVGAILGAIALLAVAALFIVIHRQTRRRVAFNNRRAMQAENAVGRLVAVIDPDPNSDDVDSKHADSPLAKWRADKAAQGKGIAFAARETSAIASTLGDANDAAAAAAVQARQVFDNAKSGAVAVRHAALTFGDTGKRIEDALVQLNQLAQHVQRFQQSAELVRDVTEQAGVLSLNAKVRGEAGEADTMSEMSQLAKRAARTAADIGELAQAIQSNADALIAGIKTAADEIANSGKTLNEDAVRALTDIETAGRELVQNTERVAVAVGGETARAQTLGHGIEELRIAAEQSDGYAAQVAADLEKLDAVTRLAVRFADFKPTDRNTPSANSPRKADGHFDGNP